eukprot:Anaeramoba_ignava/c14069_g1_i1.p2 GENE.c14069_g1_i1~~c14069_g1_i1.p2  ORF type:complete len:225 (-),score=31.96 c14069_g1_i1:1737-2411(-)
MTTNKDQKEEKVMQEKAEQKTVETKDKASEKKVVEEKVDVADQEDGKETPSSNKTGKKKTTKAKKEKKPKEDPRDKKIKELESKVNELNDKLLRVHAEYDNYRKRTMREKADLLKSGGEDVLKDLIPVVDDFDLAVANMDKTEDINSLKEGIKLIHGKFTAFLKQKGVTEVEAMHAEFDTDKHEALTKIPAPEEKLKGKIVDVIQKGYKLHDKVIRFAKVVIGE